MSAGTKRRLEDALNAGKDIEKDSKLPSVTNVDFGDVMGIYSLNFSHNMQNMVAGSGNGSIQVYSCGSQRKRRPLKHGSLYGLPITALKFFPFKDDQLITATHNEICALDFSHDGRIFATAGKDRKIRVYDAGTLQIKQTFGGTDHIELTQQVFIIYVFSPEAGHGSKVFALRFHPFDDNLFLTGGWDRHIKIWDFGSSQLLETVPFPSASQGEFLYVGRFCGSGDLIAAGGSGTNDLKIINRKTRGVSSRVESEGKTIHALDVSQDGQHLVIGGTGNSVQIVTLT
ncbi:COMPASS-like H3K4 histone methylase component WDR5A [Acropora cervicornis]|uniref:COMPASS-like H3K4 histone methylase component WDR5A n=1 Tax=Acropora cervicornis TaxID=6130 RepID=A0AAD9R3T7_ACRCE|nr:COMPASS-like H3K4 histone methylase component WDR5A [Acropora cervicornis]